VRGSPVDNVEGDLGLDRVVVLEFPSLEQAKKLYHSPEYQDIARNRMASSTSHVAVLEGCLDPTEAFRSGAVAAE